MVRRALTASVTLGSAFIGSAGLCKRRAGSFFFEEHLNWSSNRYTGIESTEFQSSSEMLDRLAEVMVSPRAGG